MQNICSLFLILFVKPIGILYLGFRSDSVFPSDFCIKFDGLTGNFSNSEDTPLRKVEDNLIFTLFLVLLALLDN